MIRFHCDKCDVELAVDDALATTKYDCPHCGDVNRVPDAPPQDEAPDRALEAGLPPDSGPEQEVQVLRRSLLRSHPGSCAVLVLFPFVLPVALGLLSSGFAAPTLVTIGAAAAALAWGALVVWWVAISQTALLRITNKRTIERRGLLSRSTNEVLHNHVRNIRIEQSFKQRLFNVGRVGISSSGQDGIEIQINHVPDPRKVKGIIDAYRPL